MNNVFLSFACTYSKILYNKTIDINKVNKVINNILLEAIYKSSLILMK